MLRTPRQRDKHTRRKAHDVWHEIVDARNALVEYVAKGYRLSLEAAVGRRVVVEGSLNEADYGGHQ